MKTIAITFCLSFPLLLQCQALSWKKHLVMDQGHCNTAVALDVNGDKDLDIIASFNGKISLFLAPDWKLKSCCINFLVERDNAFTAR
jgi:hypothetical protein